MWGYLRSIFSWRGEERKPSWANNDSDDAEQEEGEDGGKPTTTVQPVSAGLERVEAWDLPPLLPGILNEITLNHITPKLPWKAFHILSSVSRAWKDAIRCRHVYDARVRSHSRDTLVVINHFRSEDGNHGRIGLYSVNDRSFYMLPGIPRFQLGVYSSVVPLNFAVSSQCVALDGKIYILGGLVNGTLHPGSDKVYVMDLAVQGQWRRCAGMNFARRNFGCGVLDGKIYVTGGFFGMKPVLVPEVYDPNLDVWSPIQSMISIRTNHKITALGDELLVHGGQMINPAVFYGGRDLGDLDSEAGDYTNNVFILGEYCYEIYNPARNEWRDVQPLNFYSGKVFVVDGKIYAMNKDGIYVYDVDRESWAHTRSLSFAAVDSDLERVMVCIALPVNNELVAVLGRLKDFIEVPVDPHLVHSIGFGESVPDPCADCPGHALYGGLPCPNRGGESFTWQKPECGFQLGYNPLLCAIEL